MTFSIDRLDARQVLDSRGNPTIEVEAWLHGGGHGRAMVPSGASTGSHEAVELRDGGGAWGGKGVTTAIGNVTGEIATAVCGTSFDVLGALDRAMVELDGTPNKGRLGANGILGVSLAVARALADVAMKPTWQWLAEVGGYTPRMPVPMLNIVNGGEHANNAVDIQEYMVVPNGFDRFGDGLQAAVKVFHVLKGIVDARGFSTAVGDEGGFAPNLGSNREALELVVQAIEQAGYEPGSQVSIAIDVAATELYVDGVYRFAGDGTTLDAAGVVDLYESYLAIAPIVSIEDGMSEDDWDGWKLITDRLGDRLQLVGDDVFVTNPTRLQHGIDAGVANAMLVKVNQIGTLTETLEAMELATSNGYRNVMSHRSGETEDAILADLAVGTGCGQIKTGAPSRSERVAKYNQLLRIESALGDAATYDNPFAIAAGTNA